MLCLKKLLIKNARHQDAFLLIHVQNIEMSTFWETRKNITQTMAYAVLLYKGFYVFITWAITKTTSKTNAQSK